MTRSFLNSSTALAVSATLAMPLPATAQSTPTVSPCLDAEGAVWTAIPQRGKEHKDARQAAKKKDKNLSVNLTSDTSQCVVTDGQTQLLIEGTVTESGGVYASFKQVMKAVKATPETTADAAAESESEEQAAAEAATAATAEAGAGNDDVAEAEATGNAEVEAENTATEAEAAENTGSEEDNAAAEAEATGEAEQDQQTTGQGSADAAESGSEVESAEGDASSAQESGAKADATVEGSAAVEAEAGASAETDAAETTDPEVTDAEPEVQQEDTAESTAVANEAVTAEAAQATETSDADSDADKAKVEKRKIRQEQIRKSNQEFANAVSAQVAAAAAANKDDGLSNFEKFAIGALGIAAAGTLLNNGDKVVSNSGDRVVVQRADGNYEVLKDDNVLLRQPGVEIETERFGDGSTRETVYREDGTQVVTIKAANGQVLRRVRVLQDGTQILLFDDTDTAEPVQVTELPRQQQSTIELTDISSDELRLALAAQEQEALDRRFSLQQIRQIRAVRELVPVIELEDVTFDTGSAAIRATEAEELRDLGLAMKRLIEENPSEVFLVEGHTDAVGNATFNLALSDRRAESVALALTEYFEVPPENMVVQGYGESNLKIRTPVAERENRRATVRRITTLLQTASMQ